jgi:hypothetical protein
MTITTLVLTATVLPTVVLAIVLWGMAAAALIRGRR